MLSKQLVPILGYLQNKPPERASRPKDMQMEKPRNEDSFMKELSEKRVYTLYTDQEKARFFKLKFDKCLSASAAAKLLEIHVCTAQRWAK